MVPLQRRATSIAVLCLAVMLSGSTAWGTLPQTAPASQPAASYVRLLDLTKLNQRLRELPARERELIAMYLEAGRRVVLDVTDGCYPDPNYSTHCRNLGERAKGAAVLCSLTDYWPADFRAHCRQETVKLLREVGSEFRKDPNFRYPWQAAFWAAETGIAAWFLWDDLDAELRAMMADMVAFQADRFIDTRPATHVKGNTEAETVSWNSTILTLAVNMMPDHPHHAAWDRAAKTYLYSTLSTSQDLKDDSRGDDGLPIKQWVVGANLYDDFGLENHDMFHIEYVFASFRFHMQGYALYGLTGRQPPQAFRHHARDVYERLMLPCVNHEGFAVYVSDNDWKRYHNWAEDCTLHAYMASLERSELAAGLEERALRNATRYWRAFSKGFGYDNPYVCGKPWTSRIADAVLLHVMPAGMPEPLTQEQIDSRLAGASEVPSGHLLTHKDARGVFSSFCRGKGGAYVRYVAPSSETWLTLPLVSNYRGQIGGKPIMRSLSVRSAHGKDGFWVARWSLSGRHPAEAFVSMPDGITVHMERAPAGSLPAGAVVENSVGIEKPHRKLTASYQSGTALWDYGAATWKHDNSSTQPSMPGNWINLDTRFGLIFVTAKGAPASSLSLPKPGVRDAVRALTPALDDRSHLLAIVACPDFTPEETAKLAGETRIEQDGACVRCVVGQRVIVLNCGTAPARVTSPDETSIELQPGALGVWLDGHRLFDD